MNEKISLIVAIYNTEPYLRRCLDSIIEQTYQQLEIILVNDGSTDSSGVICDEYAKRDKRIKVIHKKNGGVSDARNIGISAATGGYIGYVDSDDFIEPNMYEKMLNALIEHDAQITICRFRRVDNDTSIKILDEKSTGEVHIFSRDEALNIFVSEDEKCLILPSVWSKLFAREIVDGQKFDLVKSAEEIMYTTKALCRAKRVVYIDEFLYNYVVERDGSLMSQKNAINYLDNDVPILKEQIEFLHSQRYSELANKAAYAFYRRLLFYYIDFKNEKQKEQAKRIIKMLKDEWHNIKSIYANPWVKSGDKVRMNVFHFYPHIYYLLVKGYDRFIIPVRKLTL